MWRNLGIWGGMLGSKASQYYCGWSYSPDPSHPSPQRYSFDFVCSSMYGNPRISNTHINQCYLTLYLKQDVSLQRSCYVEVIFGSKASDYSSKKNTSFSSTHWAPKDSCVPSTLSIYWQRNGWVNVYAYSTKHSLDRVSMVSTRSLVHRFIICEVVLRAQHHIHHLELLQKHQKDCWKCAKPVDSLPRL